MIEHTSFNLLSIMPLRIHTHRYMCKLLCLDSPRKCIHCSLVLFAPPGTHFVMHSCAQYIIRRPTVRFPQLTMCEVVASLVFHGMGTHYLSPSFAFLNTSSHSPYFGDGTTVATAVTHSATSTPWTRLRCLNSAYSHRSVCVPSVLLKHSLIWRVSVFR